VAVAVLISGGLDSAILLGESLQHHPRVYPLYVRSGLLWESAEQTHLLTFLEAIRKPALMALTTLDVPVLDLYGNHWSLTGQGVPDTGSADEAVFLPGRNILLASKAILWCHLNRVFELTLGVLRSNPFADATPAFFDAFQDIVNTAIGGHVKVCRPFAGLSKVEVIHRGAKLPLGLTFSCIRPVSDRHCGRCNKCAERRRAFADAHISDTTPYDQGDSCIA
jgi:7-cyano-7-deazaguanine synthase